MGHHPIVIRTLKAMSLIKDWARKIDSYGEQWELIKIVIPQKRSRSYNVSLFVNSD
jgi:hypothetical protein